MQKGLVSVLTPCYNTALYLPKLLESVLSQTYNHIEMIVIDDGSKDDSASVVEGYVPRFLQRGYTLACHRQENGGQSVAINNGLKMVSGEFLVWPDSDDYYSSPESIEKMVRALQTASEDTAMVRTLERVVDEQDGRTLHIFGEKYKGNGGKSLFYDCLFAQNGFYFCSGAYMVKLNKLAEQTQLTIYTDKNAGQNWQLMLPILYHYRCHTLKEILYTVVARKASHSRGQYKGYQEQLTKFESYESTILCTLNSMQMDELKKEELKFAIRQKYMRQKLLLDFEYFKKQEFQNHYRELCHTDRQYFADRWLYVCACLGLNRTRFFKKCSIRIYYKLCSNLYDTYR